MDEASKKAFQVLEYLVQADAPVGVTEIGKALSLGKSTVHRVLGTLVGLGYAANNLDGGRYRATLKVWEIGIRLKSRHPLWRAAQSHLRALHKETNETIYLTVLAADEVLFLDRLEGDYPIRTHPLEGVRTPLYCTATGKALLAFLGQEAIDRIAANLTPRAEATITDAAKLREELYSVRARGYAVSLGEWRPGLNAVAAPIRTREEELIGAVSIAGPVERMTNERIDQLAPLVMNAATRISGSL